MRIIVVGSGVIGLSCAHRLAGAGHEVEVWSRDGIEATTSMVAAALWYPYRAYPEDAVTRWAGATYDVLTTLADVPETGVAMRAGRDLSRTPLPDPWWAAAVPDLRRVPDADLPPGYVDGYALVAPVIRMPTYLPWLVGEVTAAGVRFSHRKLTDLDAARSAGDVVVNAVGLGARELLGDDRLTPVRGQVVKVRNPGLTDWTLDEEHPDGIVYVIPRGPDVVCGGTAQEGLEYADPDPQTAAAILERCRQVVPELGDAEVIEHSVGLRPVRTEIRLERVDDVVHCYGHGGAGVSLSWGCADEVVGLVEK